MDPVDDYAALMAECEYDPLKFVEAAFPWGELGTELENKTGAREWQRGILADVRDRLKAGEDASEAIRLAVASGHGIGKSALVSWLILWGIATKVDCRGIVTANTAGQLESKTWAEVAKWHNLFIGKQFFDITSSALFSSDQAHCKTWRVDAIPWSVDRTESFAGMHNEGKRILIVFDEASAIDDAIWEVTEGALTDEKTQILWCCFGNPTRNNGRFRECFRQYAHRWKHQSIDSRTVEGTSKRQLDEFIADHGVDSDFVKIRVLGQFPMLSENTLLSAKDIDEAVKRRHPEEVYSHEPAIVGCDVARDGNDSSVAMRRQGCMSFEPNPTKGGNSFQVADSVWVESSKFGKGGADGQFIDGTGGFGHGVYDQCMVRNMDPILVHFNSKASDPQFFNKRSEMIWLACKWVKDVGHIPDHKMLREELAVVSVSYKGDKLYIMEKAEMKKILGRSPDYLDSLALTFAYPVAKKTKFNAANYKTPDWDVYAD